MRKLSGKSQNTRFMFRKFFRNGALYEIMLKNMDDADRPQMTIRRGAEKMRFANRITKARTHAYNYNV
jgi:hypothetical protein